jgi:Protein of unknown function (DUF2934)
MKALANPARPRKRYCSMPRKRKISENEIVSADGAVAGNGSNAQPALKKKSAPRRKPAAKKAVPTPAGENVETTQITDEAIRVRAYHIAEERALRGLPGDENSDWLEARRQLMAELG